MPKHLNNSVKMPQTLLCAMLLVAGLLAAQPAVADVSFSGFGTIGYARSDQSYNYQRFINNSGTFLRDTLMGAQMDARFNPEWGATVQAKVAPSISNDNGWQPSISWAFLSYRPDNDWLIRVGKLRESFYLNAENMDVGATFDTARLPIEVYSISPTMDFNGASFAKAWSMGDNELDLDGFWGQAKVPWRSYTRDTATAQFSEFVIKPKGLLLTLHQQTDTYRIGYFTADVSKADGNTFPVTMVQTCCAYLPPGMTGTYYTKSGQVSKMVTPAITLGMDVDLGHGIRTMAEYLRHKVTNSDLGPDTESYYLSLLKNVDHWTPYITYAKIKSKNIAIYQAVNGAQVQGGPPGVAVGINSGQRVAADSFPIYDQHSVSVGTSYSVTRTSKIKVDWTVVKTGAVSTFVDAPVGGESGNRHINVYSLSYNFVF